MYYLPESNDLKHFDWVGTPNVPPFKRNFESDWTDRMDNKFPSLLEKKRRMLDRLADLCNSCVACELGRNGAERDGIVRDPHVLSNNNYSRIIVCGQNPGWEELKVRKPFVGAAGKNFDKELEKNGLDRSAFYITNAVKCFTKNNDKPSHLHLTSCRGYLQLEIRVLRPQLVVTLGSFAFGLFCPDKNYQDSLGKITMSKEFDVKVFAIYHPSPLNLSQIERKKDFEKQMKLLSGLVTRLRSRSETESDDRK